MRSRCDTRHIDYPGLVTAGSPLVAKIALSDYKPD